VRPARAFTLAELCVVVVVTAILAALVVPAGLHVRRLAVATACTGNLRQVGLAFASYAQDWDGRYPAEGNLGATVAAHSPAWFDRLPDYLDAKDVRKYGVFQCAGYRWKDPTVFTNASPKSFKMNSYLDDGDRPDHYRQGSTVDEAGTDERHKNRVNILALDGHTLFSRSPPADGDWKTALRWIPGTP
jgi:prepilin-type processing-associated H-X9-DG protein